METHTSMQPVVAQKNTHGLMANIEFEESIITRGSAGWHPRHLDFPYTDRRPCTVRPFRAIDSVGVWLPNVPLASRHLPAHGGIQSHARLHRLLPRLDRPPGPVRPRARCAKVRR